ncbi:MAG: hypothetical protein RLZZ299_1163 [Pseudomonadota bacterium]|jgi:hypothetical protein
MRRGKRIEGDSELDVTPILSLIVHLIPMILLAVNFRAFAQVTADGPVLPTEDAPSAGALKEQSRQVVSVRVLPDGFEVGGAGDAASAVPCRGACTVDTYDYVGLRYALRAAKAQHPAETRVVVAPARDVPFAVIVRVMDAARESRDPNGVRTPLFPSPLLAAPPPAPETP